MSVLLNIYYNVPAPIRSLAASVHGVRLSRLRYCKRATPILTSEAKLREEWSALQWEQYQHEQLSKLLREASLHVPFYRNYWKSRAGSVDVTAIKNWPILEKQSFRDHSEMFVSDLADKNKLRYTFTSGSTGSPVKVYWSVETARKWYALFEARWRNWYGVSRFDRWALIGGKQIIRPSVRKPPYWVFNRGMNQLYMSAYHLSEGSAVDYVEALKAHRIEYIYSYTSGIYTLARFMDELGLSPPPLKVIITNAEPIFAHQRDLIERVFRCPVRETYGMTEMLVGAGECDRGSLHLWPEAGYLELDKGDGVLKRTGTGQLVATGLINWDMPLIRYRTGDQVIIDGSHSDCKCGRKLPLLVSVEGRNDDLLKTRDGRVIGRLDPIFKSSYPIMEAQIVQKSLDLCVLRLVPCDGYSDQVGEEISSELKARMGSIAVKVELVDSIPRGANGKFRSVLCEID